MRTITDAEADRLREMRKGLAQLCFEVSELACKLAGACEHADDSFPDTCPVCALYVRASAASNELFDLPAHLDGYLLDGPEPRLASTSVATPEN